MKAVCSRMALVGLLTFVACVPGWAGALTLADTFFNTNYVTNAIGLRDVGAGTMTVAGVGGPVTNAVLFWHGPTNSSDPNVNGTVTVNGASVVGSNIGLASDNFWGSANSQAYRANVTTQVTGNGAVNLSNFQKTTVAGCPSPCAQINGAALFTFYDSGVSTGRRDVVFFQGNDSNFSSNFDAAGWDFTLSGINYTSGTAFLRMYVSDGQNFSASDDGTLRVNGTALATGGIFQGLAPKAPGAGVSNGSLTDIVSFDITPFLTPGLNSLHITLDAGFSDALSAVVAAVDLPAGAAPSAVPEPGTYVLVGLGLIVACRFRRIRQ